MYDPLNPSYQLYICVFFFFKINFYLIGLKLILFLIDIVLIFSGSTNETTSLLQVS